MDTRRYLVFGKHFLSRKRFGLQMFFYIALLVTGTILVCEIRKHLESEKSSVAIFEEAVRWKFLNLDGRFVSIPDKNARPCLFLLFDPECEHCIQELKEICSDTLISKHAEIFFVSLSGKKETENTVNLLYISDVEHIHTVFPDDKTRASLPQHIMLPTLLIFNEKNKLRKIIEGEINTTSILSYLNL